MPEIGQTISHYRIVEKIGQGGMGEVYLADDTTLDRKVALKFLPEAFTSDPERMARFEREAKLLASLNHPNIAGIHGLEQADGNRFLVLEYVEGETLQARLSKGALPLEEALALCCQIAEGLEAAHEKGVIHRDLKPANVMITAEEKIKILDFGLSKALADETQSIDSSQSPTLTEAMTQPGVILGTAAYMGPEQAKGKSVDKRADIWAFGCILYECLTGKKAFEGETVTETLAAVIKEEPDWKVLPENVPPNIRLVIRRCLGKEKSRRFHCSADMRIEIEDVREIEIVAAPQPVRKQPLLWVFALIAIAALVYAFWNRSIATPKEVVRLSIPLPLGEQITEPPAISPEGQVIAYVSQKGMDEPQLYLRNLNSFESRLVTGSSSAKQPFFSPDGKWIAFFAKRQLFRTEVTGGTPIRICDVANPIGGTWNEDNTIVYTTGLGAGLLRISERGGDPVSLTKPDFSSQGYAHAWPQALPGGRRILFDVWGMNREIFRPAILSLDSNQWEIIPTGAIGCVFCLSSDADGYLLSSDAAGGIRVARFDPKDPSAENKDTLVLKDVFFSGDNLKIYLAVSKNGTAVYAQGNPNKKSLTWIDREGKSEELAVEKGPFDAIALSPDGSQLLVAFGYEIWKYDVNRPGIRNPITPPGSTNYGSPVWSHDGSRIYFSSNRGEGWDIYTQVAESSISPEVLLARPNDQFPISATRDGTLLFREFHPMTGADIWALSPDGEVTQVLGKKFNEYYCAISPNEHWIAYESDETGRSEIYIQEYPEGKKNHRVSTGGGVLPKWSHDGKELFYRDYNALMAVTVGPDGTVTSEPYRIYDSVIDYESTYNSYDISPDDRKFLIIRQDPGSIPNQLNVILNWTEELQRLVPKEGQ